MKKSRILLGVLTVLAVLVLASCGGLTSSARETGNFTFSIDDALIQHLARTGSDTATYTINARLYSLDSNASYDMPKNTSGTLATLKTGSLSFENVPLNVNLALEIKVLRGTMVIYKPAATTFKLTSGNTTIDINVFSTLNTPVLLSNDGAASVYDWETDLDYIDFTDPYDDSLKMFIDADCYSPCVDYDQTFWYITADDGYVIGESPFAYDDDLETWCYGLNDTSHRVTAAGSNQVQLVSLHFDPIQNKLCVLFVASPANSGPYTWYMATYTPDDVPQSLVLPDNNSVLLSTAPFEVASTESNYSSEPVPSALPAYVYDGCLYSIRNRFRDPMSNTATLVKTPLANPSTAITTTLQIPGTEPSSLADYTSRLYEFNDIAVVDDTVCVLYHEQVIWYTNNKLSFTTSAPFPVDNGFIDRGGMITLSKDLTGSSIHFTPETMEECEDLPVRLDNTKWLYTGDEAARRHYYPRAYISYDSNKDELSGPITKSIPVTWSLPFLNPEEPAELGNPRRFVAIKPKKLIIADCGTSWEWYDGDWSYNGYDFASLKSTSIVTSPYSRLVEVDLEHFSAATVAPLDDAFYGNTMASGFKLTYSRGINGGETVYAREVVDCVWDGDAAQGQFHEMKGWGTDYHSEYSIETSVEFGSVGN